MGHYISSKKNGDSEVSLPQGWIRTTIGEITHVDSGIGFPEKYQGKTDGDIPFYKVMDISKTVKSGGIYLTKSDNYISFQEFDVFRAKLIKKDSLVFAKIGAAIALNRRAILSSDALVDNNIMAVNCDSNNLNGKFFYYFFLTQKLGDLSRATTVPSIRKSDVENISMLLPPFQEQHRIVAKIEELFTQLDAGIASLKKAQAQLLRYRQAVLKAAFEGRLTQEWREEHKGEIEPASDLLKKISHSSRKKTTRKYNMLDSVDLNYQSTLPDEWILTQVQEVGSVQLGRQRAPPHHHGPNMRPYLRVANVFENHIDISDVKSMNFTPEEFEIYRLKYADILLNEGQSKELVGRPAIFRNELPDVCFQNTLVRFRAYEGVIPEYALQLFISYLYNGQFSKIASQSTNIAHLGAERFAKMPFPLAPYLEQKEILSEIDRHFSIISKINDDVETSLRQAETLRQSILKRAFEGKLVPQDPNDEPASVLLERIKAEKASRASEGKKGKTLQRRSPKRRIKNAD